MSGQLGNPMACPIVLISGFGVRSSVLSVSVHACHVALDFLSCPVWLYIADSKCSSNAGVVVSCAAAFRQLFVSSSGPQKKSPWSPTESYHARIKSMWRRRGKRAGIASGLYDIPSTFHTVDGGLENTVSLDGPEEFTQREKTRDMVLNPTAAKTVSTCSASLTTEDFGREQGINKEIVTTITRGP